MIDVDPSLVNWSRAMFAFTAMYHWIFVPLTLGLSFLCAFFETIYLKTGDEQWKTITKFWMTLFGINFAIGVATGIILEFEFGTNWSNYSWMVGDIFGAPLAVEGIFAFFMEASFFAVMFFGWDRVSKGFHCFSTWMVAIGSNLSAVWILVANGWMQNPVGMAFNPEKARFEMQSFAEVVFNPVAVSKFTHTSSSGFVMASAFVLTVSCWYLIKGRHVEMAKKSIVVASVFGLIASCFVGFTGDEAAYEVAQKQPMKLAAMEGLYKGERGAGIVAMGIVNDAKAPGDVQDPFLFEIKIPQVLSLLANRELGSFVPGVDDLVWGNEEENLMGVNTMMEKGRYALTDLAAFKEAKKAGDENAAAAALARFNVNQEYMGYGYLNTPEEAVPPVALVFNSFHIMAVLGTLFPVIFGAFLFFSLKGQVAEKRWLLPVGLFTGLLAFVAGQAGWVTAEVGRQPWAIQGLMPVKVATTNLSTTSVQITFAMFAVVFTLLLLAEISIMLKQISIGPEATKMISNLDYVTLQQLWWVLCSVVGALFLFQTFVQGGQTLLWQMAKTETETALIVNSLGRKWELPFTTLVLFGGALFASFPKFYSTSFGGAYWVWILILFTFVIQAVSYEYRTKPANVLGAKVYELFLFINGSVGVLLIGAAVGTFYTGSSFSVNDMNQVSWQYTLGGVNLRGLEAAFSLFNLSLGLFLVFNARVLGALYLLNNLELSPMAALEDRLRKAVWINFLCALPFLLYVVVSILLRTGFGVDDDGVVSMVSFKYLFNLLALPHLLALLLAGLALVIWGVIAGAFKKSTQGIWFAGLGTVLVGLTVLCLPAFNGTAFYPSTYDLQSSLTIYNASSSKFTLATMTYVALAIPLVLAYVAYLWRQMDSRKLTTDEAMDGEAY